MTVADEQLERFAARLNAWDREDARDASKSTAGVIDEAFAIGEALRPVISVVIMLAGPRPIGTDAQQDASWSAMVAFARREILALQDAGNDLDLAPGSLRLLSRVDALVAAGGGRAWEALVRARVTELFEARSSGRERGRRLTRAHGGRPRTDAPGAGWLLRHPSDYWLRHALRTTLDQECRREIQALVDLVMPSYERLCELDWSEDEAEAEAVCTVEIITSTVGASRSPEQVHVTEPAGQHPDPAQRHAPAGRSPALKISLRLSRAVRYHLRIAISSEDVHVRDHLPHVDLA